MVPLAAPLAALQAAINAAAGLGSVFSSAVDVALKRVKDDMRYHVEVGLNRWAGAFPPSDLDRPDNERSEASVTVTDSLVCLYST